MLQISTKFQKVAVCKSVGLHFHVDTHVRVSAMSATENTEMCGVLSSVRGEEGCFMSEDNCFCLDWRGRKNTADVHVGLTVSFTFPVTHSRHLQHWFFVWDLSWIPQPLKMMALSSFKTLTTLYSATSQKVEAQRSLDH